jgi:lysophospholipase L1-like esterase
MFAILCFGDSITFGVGELPTKGWAGRLKDDFEPKGEHNCVYNLGVRGQTSTHLLKRFHLECEGIIKHNYPDDKYIIIIAIGTNDAKVTGKETNVTADNFKNNLDSIMKQAKEYDAEVVLLSIPAVDEKITKLWEGSSYTNARIRKFNEIIRAVSKEKNAKYIDINSTLGKPEDFTDGLHPSSKGYDLMYVEVKKGIKELIQK